MTVFPFDGVTYRQQEAFFLVRVDAHDVDTTRFTELEVAAVLGHRWWPVEEIRRTEERVYPEELLDVLERCA